MNIFSEQNSLKYINDRDYVKHLIMYLMKYESQILIGKKTIGQIGIEFYRDEIKVKIGNDLNINELINQINEESNVLINNKITNKKKKQRRVKTTLKKRK